MKFKDFVLLALLTILLGLTACGEKETPTRLAFEELRIPADDVTLHVRIAGNPEAPDVLLAVNMGPGFSILVVIEVVVLMFQVVLVLLLSSLVSLFSLRQLFLFLLHTSHKIMHRRHFHFHISGNTSFISQSLQLK